MDDFSPNLLSSKHVSIPGYHGRVEDLNYVYLIKFEDRTYYVEFANFAVTHITTLLKEAIPFHYSVRKINSILPYILNRNYFKNGKSWFKLYSNQKLIENNKEIESHIKFFTNYAKYYKVYCNKNSSSDDLLEELPQTLNFHFIKNPSSKEELMETLDHVFLLPNF